MDLGVRIPIHRCLIERCRTLSQLFQGNLKGMQSIYEDSTVSMPISVCSLTCEFAVPPTELQNLVLNGFAFRETVTFFAGTFTAGSGIEQRGMRCFCQEITHSSRCGGRQKLSFHRRRQFE